MPNRLPHLVAGLALVLMAPACELARPSPHRTTFAGSKVEVPITLSETDDVLVDVWIDSQGPFRMLIDTGSSVNILHTRVAAALGRTGWPRLARLSGITGATDLGIRRTGTVDRVSLGPVAFEEVGFLYADFLEEDGILALGLFAEGVVTFDLERRRLLLERGVLEGAGVLEYRQVDGLPELPVRLGDRAMLATVDTGSDSGLIVPQNLAAELRFEGDPLPFGLTGILATATVLGGRVTGTLMLGEQAVRNPIVLVGHSGNIGMGILRHFALSFDVRHRRLRLSPREPGPVTMPPVEGYAFTVDDERTVQTVLKGSKAEALGLRVGDHIVAVGGSITRDPDAPPDRDRLITVLRPGESEKIRMRIPWEIVIP